MGAGRGHDYMSQAARSHVRPCLKGYFTPALTMGQIKSWMFSGSNRVFYSVASVFLIIGFLFLPAALSAQTELGSEDDLTVLGTDGTAADPDTEIKGFAVFGSTQADYAGAVVGPGNVVVNGVLAVSSGAYFVGNSTFTGAGKIFINDGTAGQMLRKNSGGYLEWISSSDFGDNLGSHIATTTLDMATFNIVKVGSITANAAITTYSTMTVAGNAFSVGGSAFVVTSGKIGVGTAGPAEKLDVSGNVNSSGRYMVAGSTVLAALSGNRSFAVGINSGLLNTGDDNVFVGYNAGSANTSGIGNLAAGSYALYNNAAGGNYNTASGYKALYLNSSGFRNTANGAFALQNTTSGHRNTAVGYSALLANNVGDNNTAFGNETMYSNTVGVKNTALGSYTLSANTAGNNNTAVGYYALSNNPGGGSANAVLGDSAGYNPSGSATIYFSSSTLIGSYAGYNLSTGNDNIFVGWNSGYNVTTGTGNVIVGYNQLAPTAATNNFLNIGGLVYGNLSAKTVGINRTTQQAALDIVSTGTAANIYAQIWRDSAGTIVSSMTATGVLYPKAAGDNLGDHNATQRLNMGGYAIWSSSDITAARYQINGSTVLAIKGLNGLVVGVDAGRISTGQRNSFVGSRAGYSNAAGEYNAFLGYDAGSDNNSGSYNSFFGANTGIHNTTGGYNSYLGYAAGFNNTAGTNNAFVGDYAGFNNTGNENSFVGSAAGYYNTGRYNAFVGKSAGYSNTSGEHNAFFGSFAGNYNQTGSYNAIFGHGAGGYGSGAVNSFSNSTIMGYQAGYGMTTGSYNIFLGWQAGYNVTTGTGNVIIGYDQRTSAPAASNQLNIGGVLYGDLSAKTIGISTRAPQAALDIVSTGTAANIYAQIWRDGSGTIVSSMTSAGVLYPKAAGDNLGDHTATQALNLGGNYIYNVSTLSATGYISAARYLVGGSTIAAILPGTDSIAYGVNAGTSNVAGGDYNVFVGNRAGASNTSGASGAFLGYMAGFSNADGYGHVYVGDHAGYYGGAYSEYNTFVGYYAGYKNSEGTHNTYLGGEAGYSNTAGSLNTIIGYDAGYGNTTGESNTYAGTESGYYTKGSANAIYGTEAGYGAFNNSFSSATLMGYRAGYALRTGSDNVFIGYQAGYSVTTGTGNIVIGYNLGLSGATANNELNIGGVYKGLISSGTATIGKYTTQAADGGITVTSVDFGKTITVNSASAQTVTLPSVSAVDIGATITVVKFGAGGVTIQAAASTYIADSTSGGTIYDNESTETYSTITLRLVSPAKWMIIGGDGSWTTT